MKKQKISIFISLIFILLTFFFYFNNEVKDINNETNEINNEVKEFNDKISNSGDILNENGGILNYSGAILNNSGAIDGSVKKLINKDNLTKLEKTFLENLPLIKKEDFKNIKFSEEQNEKEVIEEEIQFLFNKTFITNGANIKNCKLLLGENLKHCEAEIYMFDLLMNENKSICSKFEDNFSYGNLLGSKLTNKKVCNELEYFLNDNLSSEDIKKQLLKIQGFEDLNTFYTFESFFSNKDFCTNIDVLGDKLRCYSVLYNADFKEKFKTFIYPNLIDIKYLYRK